MKILVIDDDQLVRFALSRLLRSQGHEVSVAVDGARGLDQVERDPPDIVITDIIMPEQEGFETIVKLRRSRPALKIVAISGGYRVGNRDVLSMARALGADEVIAKPFDPDDLMTKLTALHAQQRAGSTSG